MGIFDFFKRKKTSKQQEGQNNGSVVLLNMKATKANKEVFKTYTGGSGKLASSGQENSFHTSELVFSCVDYIAKASSQAMPELYQLDSKGNRTPVKDKKLKEWITNPNPFLTWGNLIEMSIQGLLLSGVAPLTFELNKGKYETWFLTSPSKVSVVPDANKFIAGYLYDTGSAPIKYKVDELCWIINPTLNNPFYGLPTVAPLLDTLSLDAEAINDLQSFYEGSNIISGILKAEYPLSPEQMEDLRNQFNNLYGKKGTERRGTAILPAKMDYLTVQATPKDAMLLDSLDVSEKRVLRVFKLNSLVLGGGDTSTSHPQELMKVVFNTAVRPYLYKIADFMSLFLTEKFGKQYVFEFNLNRVTELDTPIDVKSASAKTLFATGITTLNESRELIGLDPLDIANADKNLIPAFLAGTNAQFFQEIGGEGNSNTENANNTTKPVGSTSPDGGNPDLTI